MAKFILCVHHDAGKAGGLLLESIRGRFPNIEQENHNDVEELHRRLCLPACSGKEKEIVVVFIDSNERLERLIELKSCLEGRRLALVLHEINRKILSRSHLLRPRYVSGGKNRFSNLLSVLEKMISVSGWLDPSEGNEKATVREPN